jgi:Mut7-C ubiquitin
VKGNVNGNGNGQGGGKTVVLEIPRSFLRYYKLPSHLVEVEGPQDSTILDLIRRAGLPEVEFGIAAVNGEREFLTYQPKDGQVVELHPILMGG